MSSDETKQVSVDIDTKTKIEYMSEYYRTTQKEVLDYAVDDLFNFTCEQIQKFGELQEKVDNQCDSDD